MWKYFFFFFFFVSLLCFPEEIFALSQIDQQTSAIAGAQGANFGEAQDPRFLAARLINVSMGVVGIALTAFIVYAGYLILMSRGNEEMIAKGKRIIAGSVVGVVLLLSSYAITLFITRIVLMGDEASTPDGITIEDMEDPTRWEREGVYDRQDTQRLFAPPIQ